eukprot:scaffold10200_cov30-Phaeocystis_antarctica.AAC.1
MGRGGVRRHGCAPCTHARAGLRSAYASAAFRGAARQPLRDVPGGAQTCRRRRGWAILLLISA